MRTTILATFLLLPLFSLRSAAQTLQTTTVKLNDDIPRTYSFNQLRPGLSKTAACGPDTLFYPYYKATTFQAVSLNASTSGNMFAQWYPAPQQITVSGFEFYAWQSTGTSAVITLTCNLYYATADSLPTGPPIRSVTVNVDSTFKGGNLSDLRKSAVFSSPVTVNGAFVLTVETSSTTNVSVITNNYNATTPDGRGQWLSSVRIGSSLYRSYSINVGGKPFDADFVLQPYVSYNLTPNFTISACNQGGNTINFTNTSSPVLSSPFYNVYAFYNIAYISSTWDYGDTTGLFYAVNGSHVYNYRAPHTVTLKDTIYGFRRGCVDAIAKTNEATPAPPNPFNDGPHCSGDTLKLGTDTIAGATYQWTGPSGFSSTSKFPVIANVTTLNSGTYQVRATMNGCNSAYSPTQATIYTRPQTPVAVNDGPKCLGDSITISASSPSPGIIYHWSGPNGFNSSAAINGISEADTVMSGEYIVYVTDANCTSGSDTTKLLVYPPPAIPVLSTFGQDTLCAGDTLRLKGTSVAGAQFYWSGPSFSSGQTNPVINNVNVSKSGYYKAFVKVGSCTSGTDSIAVLVNPLPVTSAVSGSDTSTETLTKTYSVTASAGSTFNWTVQGGVIQSGNGTNSITVQWGTPGAGKVSVIETSSSGCTGSKQEKDVTISEKPHVGYEEIFSNGTVKVYPNPAGSGNAFISFRLDHPADMQYTVMDMLGKTVLSSDRRPVDAEHTEKLNVSPLAAGIYMVRISVDSEYRTIRLVVK